MSTTLPLSQYLQRLPRSTILRAGAGAGVSLILLSAGATWCINDYRQYLALGPGGPPYNIFGWAVVTFIIRPFALNARDVIWTGDYPTDGAHEAILALPVREGPRAELGGIAPHRQLTQHSDGSMKSATQNLFDNAVTLHPDLLEMKMSLYERHNRALFVRSNLLPGSEKTQGKMSCQAPETAAIARGEIGHVHPDGSIHLYHPPADARVLIEKLWAERHRLARQIPFFPGFQYVSHVGGTYLMIYGPRDDGELEVLATILRNSIRFMTGVEDLKPMGWE